MKIADMLSDDVLARLNATHTRVKRVHSVPRGTMPSVTLKPDSEPAPRGFGKPRTPRSVFTTVAWHYELYGRRGRAG